MSEEDIDINFELAESISETIRVLLDEIIEAHHKQIQDVEDVYDKAKPENLININDNIISPGIASIKDSIIRLHQNIGGVIRFEDYPSTFPQEIEGELASNIKLFYESMNTYTDIIIDQYKQVLEKVSDTRTSSEFILNTSDISAAVAGIQATTFKLIEDIGAMTSSFENTVTYDSSGFTIEIKEDMEKYSEILNVFNDYISNIEVDGTNLEANVTDLFSSNNADLFSFEGSVEYNIDIENLNASSGSDTFNFEESRVVLYLRNLFKSMTNVLRSKITKSLASNMNKSISNVIARQITTLVSQKKSISAGEDIIQSYANQIQAVTGNIINVSDTLSSMHAETINEEVIDKDVTLDKLSENIDSITRDITSILDRSEVLDLQNEFSNPPELPGSNLPPTPQSASTPAQPLNVEDIIRSHISGKIWSVDIDLGVLPSDVGYVKDFTAHIINRYISNFVRNSVWSMIR